jgi:hypothetical protein
LLVARVKNVGIVDDTPDIVREIQKQVQILMVAAVAVPFLTATEHPTQHR